VRTDRENRRSRPGSSALRKNGICGHGRIVFTFLFCPRSGKGGFISSPFYRRLFCNDLLKFAPILPLALTPPPRPLRPPPAAPFPSALRACSGHSRAIFLHGRTSEENFPSPSPRSPVPSLQRLWTPRPRLLARTRLAQTRPRSVPLLSRTQPVLPRPPLILSGIFLKITHKPLLSPCTFPNRLSPLACLEGVPETAENAR